MWFNVIAIISLMFFTTGWGQVLVTPKTIGVMDKIDPNRPLITTKLANTTTSSSKIIEPIIAKSAVNLAINLVINDTKKTSKMVDISKISTTKMPEVTEEPYIVNKLERQNYTQDVWKFFRVYGLLNCRHAFCTNLQTNRKDFKKRGMNEITGCGAKSYFVPNSYMSVLDIWPECCRYGMIPATFTSKEEINCFVKEYTKSTTINVTQLHTSHIDSSLDSRYVSCGNMRSISRSLWNKGEPNNINNMEACVALNLRLNTLEDVTCDLTSLVVCENVTETVTAIPRRSASKLMNKSAINVAKYSAMTSKEMIQQNIPFCMADFCPKKVSLKAQDKSKGGFNFFSACGSTFAIKNFPYPHKETWEKCCNLGMVPVTLDSLEEMNCLAEALNPDKKLKKAVYYHTAQVDIYLNGSYVSCVTGKAVDKNLWAYQQPQPNEACTYFSVSPSGGKLISCPCANSENALCQSVDIPTREMKSDGKSSGITKPAYIEEEIKFMKTTNLFNCASCSCKAVPYSDIWQQCCSLGLVPASFESLDSLACLINMTVIIPNKSAEKISNIFWTAQLDAMLDRRFISCTSDNAVPGNVWWTGEPDNQNMKEACVAVKFDSKTAGLQDLRCGESLPVICEKMVSKEVLEEPYMKYKAIFPIYSKPTIMFHYTSGLLNCSYATCNNTQRNVIPTISKATLEFGLPMSGCNRKFYFIPYPEVRISKSWQTCCDYDMTPAYFSSNQEILCVTELFRYLYINRNGTWKKNLKYRYVTAHYDSMLDHRFRPCLKDKKKTDNTLWNKGEPNNSGATEACAAVDFKIRNAAPLFDCKCNISMQVLCEATTIATPVAATSTTVRGIYAITETLY